MKTVLITGGSRGIGNAAVRLFAAEGWAVAFTYKNAKAEAERTAAECGATAIFCDMENENSIKSAAAEALSALGQIDCLVNNAGADLIKLVTETSTAEYDRIFDINMKSVFLMTNAVLPDMISRKSGAVVNISSIWGDTGASCEVIYSASKSAVNGYTRALAKELAPSGIRVNAVSPGVIDTEMNACFSADERREIEAEIPLGRYGTPREAAEAIFFLAGEKASYITGQILAVNGGCHI